MRARWVGGRTGVRARRVCFFNVRSQHALSGLVLSCGPLEHTSAVVFVAGVLPQVAPYHVCVEALGGGRRLCCVLSRRVLSCGARSSARAGSGVFFVREMGCVSGGVLLRL